MMGWSGTSRDRPDFYWLPLWRTAPGRPSPSSSPAGSPRRSPTWCSPVAPASPAVLHRARCISSTDGNSGWNHEIRGVFLWWCESIYIVKKWTLMWVKNSSYRKSVLCLILRTEESVQLSIYTEKDGQKNNSVSSWILVIISKLWLEQRLGYILWRGTPLIVELNLKLQRPVMFAAQSCFSEAQIQL